MNSHPKAPSEPEVISPRVPVAEPASDQPSAMAHLLQGTRRNTEHSIAVLEHRPPAAAAPEGYHAVELPAGALSQTSGRHARKGKIARLPKLERDMVNRMLQNNIPHSKIVGALDELGIRVTQRNISNWRTRGGYKEWCLAQERQLQLALMQDQLTDYLRKNDAAQLPEVGLQVAATQLSSMLLQPDAVRQLTTEPEKYSKVVDMLCRLSTHIQALQKDRNEAVRKASVRGTSEHFQREDEKAIETLRSVYSSKIGEGPRDPDIPHRNDLPPRDQLPFQEPPPSPPSFADQVAWVRKTGKSLPGIPAPLPKASESQAADSRSSASSTSEPPEKGAIKSGW